MIVDPNRPILIGGEIYRGSSYGSKHPLAIPRVSSTLDLIRALGWLAEDQYIDSPMATPDQLARFHHPDYIAAVAAAERVQAVDPETRTRHEIGTGGNPIFPEMYRRPATAAGASILAADLLAQGARLVHSPAGGTHHGRADRASGFCYFNDPVLGILRLLDNGFRRVLYVDLDAHHGDGVEAALAGEPRVRLISIHERDRWPFTGKALDDGGGTALNLPVAEGFCDAELALLIDRVVIPAASAFAPEVVVVQAGADALADDPLSRLSLTNRGYLDAVLRSAALAPRALVLGGGYNPWSVTRAWTAVWGGLNRFSAPTRLPAEAEGVLRGLTWNRSQGRNPPDHWFTTLLDPPNPGHIRDETAMLVDAAGHRLRDRFAA